MLDGNILEGYKVTAVDSVDEVVREGLNYQEFEDLQDNVLLVYLRYFL